MGVGSFTSPHNFAFWSFSPSPYPPLGSLFIGYGNERYVVSSFFLITIQISLKFPEYVDGTLADKLTESGSHWLAEGHVLQVVAVVGHVMLRT